MVEMHGHESYAEVFFDTKNGKSIKLIPVSRTDKRWVNKQRKNKEESDLIRTIGNTSYKIPEIQIVDSYPEPYAIIEHASGELLTRELFASLPDDKQNKIIFGIANFLNDMHQSKPFKQRIETFDDFEILLTKIDKILQPDVINNINHLYDFFKNKNMHILSVWSHRDLRAGNIFYDTNTDILSIIDFGESEYADIYSEIYENGKLKEIIGPDKQQMFIQEYLNLPKKQKIEIDITKFRDEYSRMRQISMDLSWMIESMSAIDKALMGFDPNTISKFNKAKTKLNKKTSNENKLGLYKQKQL